MKPGIVLSALLIALAVFACGSTTPTPAPVLPTVARPADTATPEFIELNLTIVNDSTLPVDYFWVNDQAQEENYGTLEAGGTADLTTYFEQTWRIRDQAGNLAMEYTVTQDAQQTVTITDEDVAAADPVAADLAAQVQRFKDDGRIPTTDGEYIRFEDFSEAFAELGTFQTYIIDLELENFVFIAHLKWSTALPTSDVSACGVVFARQEDNRNYAVFLDKSRVYFSSSTPSFYSELGKTSGTGRVNFGNPAEADFSLVVNQTHSYVYVDGAFIGEYTLSADKPLIGGFGYGIISGTNKDYGTRCEITDAAAWSLK